MMSTVTDGANRITAFTFMTSGEIRRPDLSQYESVKELNTILKAVVSKSLDLRFNLRRDFLNEREVEKRGGG